MPAIGEAPPNLLRNLMDQVEDLDLDAMAGDELGTGQVSNLLVPGLEMSKIFAVVCPRPCPAGAPALERCDERRGAADLPLAPTD